MRPVLRQLLLPAGVIAVLVAAICVVMALRRSEPSAPERLQIPDPAAVRRNMDVPARPAVEAPSRAQEHPEDSAVDPANAPTSAKPIEQKTIEIAWSDGNGGSWRTRITVLPAAVTTAGQVQHADIATRQVGEQRDQIFYRARVIRGTQDSIRFDARGAAVSGPLAQDWIPDSFIIATDDSVRIDDGMHRPNEGWVVQTTRVSP